MQRCAQLFTRGNLIRFTEGIEGNQVGQTARKA